MPANPTIIRRLLAPEDVTELLTSLERYTGQAAADDSNPIRLAFARYQLFTEETETALKASHVADMPPTLDGLRRIVRDHLKGASTWSGAVVTASPDTSSSEDHWKVLGITGFEKVAAVHVALSPYRIQFRFGRRIESVFSLSAGDAVTIPRRGLWEFRADESRGRRFSVDLLDLPGPFATS